MQLTPHFSREEFEVHAKMPEECVESYTHLAGILEQIRTLIEKPIFITSGYRTPEQNEAIHGVPHSQHVASKDWAAADWFAQSINSGIIFSYIITNPYILGWDQCILESNEIVHLSWSRNPRRMALEGATYNQSSYVTKFVVDAAVSA